jgi:magnesium chelatase family protein
VTAIEVRGAQRRCRSQDLHGCPCGYYGDSKRACTCAEAAVSRYQRRISGPLLDRLDIFSDVPRVEFAELTGEQTGEHSTTVRERVTAARVIQTARFAGTAMITNSEMGPQEVRTYCQSPLADEAQPLLASAMEQLSRSRRAPSIAC